MVTINESEIIFNDTSVSDALINSAEIIPSVIGYDLEDENFLEGRVLQIRFVESNCAEKLFGKDVNLDQKEKGNLLRIDYETKAIPKKFDAGSPECITYRKEHIYVWESVVLSGKISHYGHGPNYFFEYWNDDSDTSGTPLEVGLSKTAFQKMLENIRSEEVIEIEEWTDGDIDNIPEGISKEMRDFYLEVIEGMMQRENDIEAKKENL